jgi:SAM-dependent methyltransferase
MPREWPADGVESVNGCPACGDTRRTLLYSGLTDTNFSRSAPGVWQSWRCASCRTAYLDPRPNPETIGLAYQAYYTHIPQGPGAVGRLGALVLDVVPVPPGGGRLLDIGSGAGAFVLAAAERGWNAEGLEPDESAVAASRSRGAHVTHGGTESLGVAEYDVITMNHAIEHVHDPVDSLTRMRDALRPGGSVFLATPNLKSVGHRLFGTDWYGLDPPRHLQVFTQKGLGISLERAGFGRIEWRPGVGLAEARARVHRARAQRAVDGSAPLATPADQPDAPPSTSEPSAPPSRRRAIARHPLTSAALRALEFAAPSTADELLVRAWPR